MVVDETDGGVQVVGEEPQADDGLVGDFCLGGRSARLVRQGRVLPGGP
ncbi:hypothetical protein ACF07T_16915 [Streptomyces sp. NPDC015184]